MLSNSLYNAVKCIMLKCMVWWCRSVPMYLYITLFYHAVTTYFFNNCFTYELGNWVVILFMSLTELMCVQHLAIQHPWRRGSVSDFFSELLESFLVSLISSFPLSRKSNTFFLSTDEFFIVEIALSDLLCVIGFLQLQ